MATYGRALRQGRQHETANARPCAHSGCDHRCDSHRELAPDDPAYRPLRFACAECDCPNFIGAEAGR